MGKHKSRRYKLHAPAPSKKSENSLNIPPTESPTELPVPEISGNVFEGIDILSLLEDAPKKPFDDDDTRSVKSYVSNKSIKGENLITKKEKRRLKREFLLKKIDTVNQLKKELKQKRNENKQKESSGDMKNLLDSLPLVKPSTDTYNIKQSGTHHIISKKKKAIEKSRKLQKTTIHSVNFYQKLLKNAALTKDPFGTISEHLKTVVEKERKAIEEPNKSLVKKKTMK